MFFYASGLISEQSRSVVRIYSLRCICGFAIPIIIFVLFFFSWMPFANGWHVLCFYQWDFTTSTPPEHWRRLTIRFNGLQSRGKSLVSNILGGHLDSDWRHSVVLIWQYPLALKTLFHIERWVFFCAPSLLLLLPLPLLFGYTSLYAAGWILSLNAHALFTQQNIILILL